MFVDTLPLCNISRVRQHFFTLVRFNRCVNGQWMQSIHGCVIYGADDPGWADDVPGHAAFALLAMIEQYILLGIVKVWFDGNAGVGLDVGRACWTEVDTVVFRACLQENTFRCNRRKGQGGQEVA